MEPRVGSRKIKLLIYSHFFAPSVGGVETVVQALARGLAEANSDRGSASYEVSVVTMTPEGNSTDFDESYGVIRQPRRTQLLQLIRRADIVHVAGAAIAPILLGFLCGKPIVVEHHGFQTICPTGQLLQEPQNIPCPGHFRNGNHGACLRCRVSGSIRASFRLWLLTFVRRFLCQRVAVNIVPTVWLGDQLGLPRTEAIAHGLPPLPALVRIRGDKETPAIVFIGRLVTTKGIGLLLEAAGILRQEKHAFQLLVVGSGPEREGLEARARELHVDGQVRFLGHLSQEQVETLLAKATAVVVPSLGGEVFGMVLAENMLRGVPIIASDLGAFAEVLGGTGQIFRSGDSRALAERIRELIQNPGPLEALGKTARIRALEQFQVSRMVEDHSRIYRGLVEE